MSPGDLFLRPELWPALLLVPAVGLGIAALDRARRRHLERAVGPRAAALADLGLGRLRWRLALAAAALLLTLLAALRPVWGAPEGSFEQRGVDLVVCLDVSRSMLARDVEPSRLERARQEIRALAETARGDRLALVVFAGEARLLVPLTRDLDSFSELVGRVDPLGVPRGGTDLGAALAEALRALGAATGQHEAVILVTDGEDHGSRGVRVAEECRARHVTVHAVGLGSTRGAKIAVEGEGGEAFLRDRTGAEVVSAMDPASLRRIAETTGGAFVDAADEAHPLVEVYDDRIRPMARKAFDEEERRERPERFQWALLAAVLLWIARLGLSERGRGGGPA